MDLQHPAITQTLKTGYPDSTGKPTNKIYFDPNYNRGREDYQMEFEEMTVRQLLDMGAEIDVFLYSDSKEKATSIIKQLGIKDIKGKSIDDVYWVESKYVNANIYSFYNEVFE